MMRVGQLEQRTVGLLLSISAAMVFTLVLTLVSGGYAAKPA